MIHDASFESDGSERSDLTPFDRVAQRSLIFRTDRGFVCFVSSGYNLRCFNFVEKPRFTFRAKNKHTSFSANSLLLLSLSFLFAALAFQSLSWVEKKRRKNRKFIVALTVNLSRSDIFVRKNLNTLERAHKISRCFERLTPSLGQFLSCVYELRNFWMGRKEGEKERKEGREREREEKRNTIRTARACATRFFPRVSSCGERTVMKRRIIQAWYYLSKLFLQAVCRRTAGIPPWNWKEDYTYRRRSERKKKGEKN